MLHPGKKVVFLVVGLMPTLTLLAGQDELSKVTVAGVLQVSRTIECVLDVPDLAYTNGFEGFGEINSLSYDFDWTLIEGLGPTPVDPSGAALGTFQHASADLNGDGRLDAVVFLTHSLTSTGPPTPIQILLNDGNGSVVDCTDELIEGETPTMHFVRDIHIADLNNDNLADIFFSNTGSESGDPFVCEQNRLLLSDIDGRLHDVSLTNLPQLVDFSHGSSLADIDRDGDIDIFVANLGCASSLGSYMMENNGAGVFSIIAGGQPNVHAYFSHEGPTWTAFGDFDRDGDPDLFAASVKRLTDGMQEVVDNLILLNDGIGNFDEEISVVLPGPFGDLAQDVHIGDLDGNGWLDIVAMYNPAESPIVQVLMNHGGVFVDETLARVPAHEAGPSAYPKFALVDVDASGGKDIIFQGEEAYYFLNDGTGHFVRDTPVVKNHFSSLLILLDLNDDHIPDQIDLVCEAGDDFCELNRWYKRFVHAVP